MSNISWGKAIGTGMVTLGALTAGIGLVGPEVVEALGPENALDSVPKDFVGPLETPPTQGPPAPPTGLAGAVQDATDMVHSASESVTDAVGLGDKVDGKTAAAVVGGTLATAGVVTHALSGRSDDEDNRSLSDEELEKMKDVRRRMRVLEAEQGIDLDGDGVVHGALPSANGPADGRKK